MGDSLSIVSEGSSSPNSIPAGNGLGVVPGGTGSLDFFPIWEPVYDLYQRCWKLRFSILGNSLGFVLGGASSLDFLSSLISNLIRVGVCGTAMHSTLFH